MKRFLPQILAGMVVFMMVMSVSSIVNAKTNGDNEKVRICHRHDSVTNPYNVEEPDKSGDVDGHADHTGPVATSEAVAQALKDNHEKWGDIIPPFDYGDGQHFAGLNWTTDGQTIWNNDCNYVTEPSPSPSISGTPTPTPTPSCTPTPTPSENEFQPLSVEAECSGPEGLTRWQIDNPNDVDIDFSWELYLVGGSPVKESGTGSVSANSDTTLETNTPDDVKLVVYWCDPAQLPKECETLHVSATNEDVRPCSTPTPTPSETFHSSHGTKVKASPQVLGTSTAQPLPVTGADINYDWVYYFLIIGSLMLTYYLKIRGWQKIRA